jgi:hypothetical protein
VSTDQAGFVEVQMMAQEAAKQIVVLLANDLCGSADPLICGNGTLVVYSSNDIAAVSLYRSMIQQLNQLSVDFDVKEDNANKQLAATNPIPPDAEAAEAGIIAAPEAATGIIKSVAELINLFRTDTSFQNKTVAITDDMVVSYLVRALSDHGKTFKIYDPAIFPALLASDDSSSDLLEKLRDIASRRVKATDNLKLLDKRIKAISAIAAVILKKKGEDGDRKEKAEQLAALDCKKEKAKCKSLTDEINVLDEQIKKDTKTIGAGIGCDGDCLKNTPAVLLAKLN